MAERSRSRVGRLGVVLVLGLLAPALTVGCGDNCGDLQVICDDCVDPYQRAACESAVDSGDEDSCARDLDSYQDICQ